MTSSAQLCFSAVLFFFFPLAAERRQIKGMLLSLWVFGVSEFRKQSSVSSLKCEVNECTVRLKVFRHASWWWRLTLFPCSDLLSVTGLHLSNPTLQLCEKEACEKVSRQRNEVLCQLIENRCVYFAVRLFLRWNNSPAPKFGLFVCLFVGLLYFFFSLSEMNKLLEWNGLLVTWSASVLPKYY